MLRRSSDITARRVGRPMGVRRWAIQAWISDEIAELATMPTISATGPAPAAIMITATAAHDSELERLLTITHPGRMAVWTTAASELGAPTIMPTQTISEPTATVLSGAVATATAPAMTANTTDMIMRSASSEPAISAGETWRTERRLTAAWRRPKSARGEKSRPQASA